MNLLETIPQKRRQLILLVFFMALFNVCLVLFRAYWSNTYLYFFLAWNLLLAFIPMGISLVLRYHQHSGKRLLVAGILLSGWLLFLPNSFYIITDLFHLRPKTGIPLWYDLLMIFSFAWNGLIVGYLSIFDVHEFLEERWNKSVAWSGSVFILVLCAFGVYLGRYLRWNSWDILTDPLSILMDIGRRVVYPAQYLDAWGITIGYSLFFILGYITLRVFSKAEIAAR